MDLNGEGLFSALIAEPSSSKLYVVQPLDFMSVRFIYLHLFVSLSFTLSL